MRATIEKYADTSGHVEFADLDWEEAKRVGLTPDEVFALTYFSDIESQTVRYLKNLLSLKVASRAEVTAFLSIWNYEEFFHGFILAKLLDVCGHGLREDRATKVTAASRFNEWLEKIFGPILSFLFARQFPATYFSFGAIQEMTTLRGYERMGARTRNPVLKTLCERIAKQERRHFAWYFSSALQELRGVKGAKTFARKAMEFNWVPVGAGVKTDEEVSRLYNFLFPGEEGVAIALEIDAKIGSLPGLQGIQLMSKYQRGLVAVR